MIVVPARGREPLVAELMGVMSSRTRGGGENSMSSSEAKIS